MKTRTILRIVSGVISVVAGVVGVFFAGHGTIGMAITSAVVWGVSVSFACLDPECGY